MNIHKAISKIQFWKTPEVQSKRNLRLKIRNNYKTSRAIFHGIFGSIKVSDYVDNESMIISKTVESIDKTIIRNAIRTLRNYGFNLTIHQIDDSMWRVAMTPSEFIGNYITQLNINPDSVDHSDAWKKMQMTME